MKIILTGSTGLIGSRFEELMLENHEIIPMPTQVDITDPVAVSNFFNEQGADVLIHFAGKTDVDLCEDDKNYDLGVLNIGEKDIVNFDVSKISVNDWVGGKSAFAVNVVGTVNLYNNAKEKGIKFVYISSDFVFSGYGEYDENSIPSPINWYGMTKYLGEKVIDLEIDLVVRLSFPYGYKSSVKKDFVWKIHDLLQSRDEVSLVSDQIITPTFIDDIVMGLDFILSKNVTGKFHLSGGDSFSPKEMGNIIKDTFGLDCKINEITLEKLYEGKAPRPFKSILNNARLVELGFHPKSFDEGLDLVKNT